MVKLGEGKLYKTNIRSRNGKTKVYFRRFGFSGKTWRKKDLDKALRDKIKKMVREDGPMRIGINLYTDTIYSTDFMLIKNERDVDRMKLGNDRFVDYDETALDADTRVSMAAIAFAKSKVPRGGRDLHNDCLYNCLIVGFTGYRKLPKILRSPEAFKRWLGLERDELVPLDMIPRIENKLKTNIDVTGPDAYVSPKKFPKDLKIRLYDDHYTKVYQLDEYRLLTKGYDCRQRSTAYPVMYKRDYDNNTAKICYLLGKHKGDKMIETKPLKWLNDFYQDMPLGQGYFILEVNKRKKRDEYGNIVKNKKGRTVYELPEPEDVIVEKIEEMQAFRKGAWENLDGLSKGTLNPMHCNANYRLLATQFFYKTAPRLISNCDEYIYDEDDMLREDYWLQQAMTGGLIWCERGTTLKNAKEYDVNSHYWNCMKKVDFITRQGEFKHRTKLPKLKYRKNKYSIFRAEVSDYDRKLFQPNKNNFYTGIDLKTAQDEGWTIKLIQDEYPNVLEYGDECRLKGRDVFGLFIDSLYKMKKAGVPGAKSVGNCLWGYLSSYAVNNVHTEEKKGKVCAEMEDEKFIKQVIPTYQKNGKQHFIYKTYDTQEVLENGKPLKKIFRFKYSRFSPFLTALGRKAMYDSLKDVREHVFRVHTDGFVVDKELDLKMGDGLGRYKLAHEGTAVIHNNNFVDWL